ncbi:Signal transduction histidine kinase [Paractinoplanes atraurantiacus]|uniref:histidine kinase n=2 Tax=Paractinoplanes atraurantiacus TaxID=1036182 RepID=A0A285JLV5_9ACTN|nr:Signal transduction histidine kinase [Actinoplanes atraurantiacus]
MDVALAAAAWLICLYAAAEDGSYHEPPWLTFLTATLLSVPLLISWQWPVAGTLVVGVTAGAALAFGIVPDFASTGPLFSMAVVLFALGLYVGGRRSFAAASAASAVVLIGTVVADISADGPGLAGTVFAALICAASWALGWTLRERRRQAALTAARATEQAVSDERLRIAREMHDIIGHSLSLIAVKAAIANHVAQQRPEELPAALAVIEATSKQALEELRRSVGELRTEPVFTAPPVLADLSHLADRAAWAGVVVSLAVRGGEDAPEGVVLAAYRIVQESLTNVVKHAAPAKCHVDVAASDGELRIEVADDGTRRLAPAGDGMGLAGMRERVAAYGGSFTAGPRKAGGFEVVATLPYGGAR